MDILRRLIPHPFLLAIFPILSLWATNVGYIPANMVFRSLLFSIISATILFFVVHLATREWLKAGIIASVLILLVFSYGHLYLVLRDTPLIHSIIRHRYLLPFTLLVCAILMILIWKKDQLISPITMLFNVVGLILVSIPLLSLLLFQLSTVSSDGKYELTQISTEASGSAYKPDIYYIILDGYGRQDILQELYNYDNAEFIQALRTRGFYVADDSNSNYMQTLLSLGSSLNMDYLDKSVSQNGGRLSIPFLADLISHNQLRDILRGQNYKMVAFESAFEDLSWADIFLVHPEQKETLSESMLNINKFESLLISSTIGLSWLDALMAKTNETALLEEPYVKHRNQVMYALTELDRVAKTPEKKFVFVHVVSPHPPFVFDSSGDMVYHSLPYTMGDGDDFMSGSEEYIAKYTEQLQYINKLTINAIDDILENSIELPIIVIQGDHGPGAYLKWGSIEDSNMMERMGILNAYYFPDQDYNMLYPSISPVNSFRVILNKYFGAEMVLLPDDHYFSSNFDYSMDSSWTVDLVNVNEQLDSR